MRDHEVTRNFLSDNSKLFFGSLTIYNRTHESIQQHNPFLTGRCDTYKRPCSVDILKQKNAKFNVSMIQKLSFIYLDEFYNYFHGMAKLTSFIFPVVVGIFIPISTVSEITYYV